MTEPGSPGVFWINVVLGGCLFLSAFLWPHALTQRLNSAISGLLIALFATVSRVAPPARYLNAVIGIWVFASALLLPSVSPWAVWSAQAAGFGVFLVSILAGGAQRSKLAASRRHSHAHA